jgi:hypothetical protein
MFGKSGGGKLLVSVNSPLSPIFKLSELIAVFAVDVTADLSVTVGTNVLLGIDVVSTSHLTKRQKQLGQVEGVGVL